jgi:hypothetical protein
MVELAKSNHIKLFCVPFYLLIILLSPKERPADAIISLNTSIKRYATANNIPYVDYYPAMADAAKGLPYLIRMTESTRTKGYQVMELLVENAISLILS